MDQRASMATRRQGLRLAGLLTGGTAGVLAAACGQGAGSSGATGGYSPSAPPVTISFSHWGTESGLGQMNREAARQFTAQYPNVNVDLIFKPDDYLGQIRTMFAGGSPPDVFDISTPDFPAWAKEDTMQEADGYVKRDQGKGFDWNDLWPRHRDSGKYKGKTYGVLARISPYVLYYNPSLFQRAGIKPPDQTWGLNEFVDAARKLTSAPGPNGKSDLYGYALVNRNHWIWRNGADYLSQKDDKWKSTINTPAFVEALQNLIDFRQKYRVVGTAEELGNPGGTLPNYGAWLQAQQIAMHDALVARVADYRADPKMTFDRWDVAHLPKLAGARA
ncbi:MAG TPA: extracellular solute-binding protein, partial [Bryobacteraceae bacterium]